MLATAFAVPQHASYPAVGPLAHVGTAPAVRDSNILRQKFSDGTARVVGAKDHLFREGDRATHVYLVEAGHVCIYRMMPDGRRQVIDFALPGDLVGLGSINTHAANAQATVKTRVRCVPLMVLHEEARREPALGLKLYEAVSRELLAARELLFTVSQCTAAERLASFLLALSRRNERRGEEPNEIVLPMTRNDIADFLGLTIETVSRTFTRFRSEGLIDIEQCVLVTIKNMQALSDLAARDTVANA